ncbi:MAG: right-handed parallel beta-helix repeat-containing protein, partial [Anaerolineae bacterium]|nr:right-handed parallel beta-helix repeat-containing protein [Anaerolineae bacterium]
MSRLNKVVQATAAVAGVIAVAVWVAMMGTATPASASNLCVSSYSTVPYHSIQDAIDAASDGDRITIAQGTWYETLVITENITLEGGYSQKCTTRQSEDPQYTVVDGGAAGSVVSITSGSTATLDGLTLTNGQSQKGGGVYVSGASPTLNNLLVTGNVISPTGSSYLQWGYGGGVYVYEGTITLTDCDITYNTSHPDASEYCLGGGLALESEALDPAIAIIDNTRIMSNTDPSPFMNRLLGGGLYLDPQSQVTFEGTGNLIAYNVAYGGGGVYMYGDVALEGVLIRDNYAMSGGGGIHVSSGYDGGRIANNYLLRNSTSFGGASISASPLDMEIANNTIVGDLSGSDAGIYIGPTGPEG